jgi:hypothetical protein
LVILASKDIEPFTGSSKAMENAGRWRDATDAGGEVCPVSVYCTEGPKISKKACTLISGVIFKSIFHVGVKARTQSTMWNLGICTAMNRIYQLTTHEGLITADA